MAGEDFEIKSAGIRAGGVNSDAIASMKEIGIDISAQTSDTFTPSHRIWANYFVTVCDSAKEQCVSIPTDKSTLHWSIPDPYGNHYTEEEKNRNFEKVREMLRERIADMFEKIRNGDL